MNRRSSATTWLASVLGTPSTILLLAGLIIPCVASAQQEAPLSVADAYFAAIRTSDFEGAADLMHPDGLEQIGGLMRLLADADEGNELAPVLFGVDQTDISATSDEQAFAGLMRFALQQSPEMGELLGSMGSDVIGTVAEGDTIHVLSRVSMDMMGATISQMEVVSLLPHDGDWRILLTGDIAGLVAALRAQLAAGAP
ncbi:MAG: hypothetical protein R3304_08610 [Longimicrobiales bacterium]|nr:hypothetical protein [Longimicrobiales bacterium]